MQHCEIVLRHGCHHPEAPQAESNPFAQTVHHKGRTPDPLLQANNSSSMKTLVATDAGAHTLTVPRSWCVQRSLDADRISSEPVGESGQRPKGSAVAFLDLRVAVLNTFRTQLMSAAYVPAIVFDMRCLQDPNYAERGIGRHARGLLLHAARYCRLPLVGLIDAGLPPIAPELRDVLNDTAPNAYAAAAAAEFRPGCFVSPSPMTHDPLWTARLMADARWLRASVVHDFIPRCEPDRYLPTDAARLHYAAQLNWLARSDIFAPNSQSTAQDLRTLMGIHAGDIVVTGCAIDPIFEQTGILTLDHSCRHILVVGGGDPRKNPETVVRAHAHAAALQRKPSVPLVIVGNYGCSDIAAFRGIAAEAGGRPELVEFPGHVSDAVLLNLYKGAVAVVSASRYEGFSLPLAEGMAAGTPALASDIPAHRELVEDQALRFHPDDDAKLTPLLERMVLDAAWRQAVTARQAALWPRFRAEKVASRFWDTLLGRLAGRTAPVVLRGRRPRVALLSPLPPDQSGVADYTAATCIELDGLVDLHVFTEAERPLQLRATRGVVRPLSALPHLVAEFDRVVSVVGNSHFHLRIFELLQRYGGACIAHDARMVGFYRFLLGPERALAVATRELGRPVHEAELDTWLADEGRLRAARAPWRSRRSRPLCHLSPLRGG